MIWIPLLKLLKPECIQWWFINPDTFVLGRNFRINEFSGLPSHSFVRTFVRSLTAMCSYWQLIAFFINMCGPEKSRFFAFISVCLRPLKRKFLLLLINSFGALKTADSHIYHRFLCLQRVGDHRLFAAGSRSQKVKLRTLKPKYQH